MRRQINRRQFLAFGSVAAMLPILPCSAVTGAEHVTNSSEMASPHLAILDGTIKFNGMTTDNILSIQPLGNGYRAYSPLLKRFHASDSMSPFGIGGVNSYSYVSGDPVNLIDPDGHAPKVVVKKMRNMKFLDTLGSSYIYDDIHKGGVRLNIMAHGKSDGSAKIKVGGVYLGSEQVLDKINKITDIKKYQSIRTISCHSAEGGADSFAGKISTITSLPTKGFIGKVTSTNAPEVVSYIYTEARFSKMSHGEAIGFIERAFDAPSLTKSFSWKNPISWFSERKNYAPVTYRANGGRI